MPAYLRCKALFYSLPAHQQRRVLRENAGWKAPSRSSPHGQKAGGTTKARAPSLVRRAPPGQTDVQTWSDRRSLSVCTTSRLPPKPPAGRVLQAVPETGRPLLAAIFWLPTSNMAIHNGQERFVLYAVLAQQVRRTVP